jgi:hypothetical protein
MSCAATRNCSRSLLRLVLTQRVLVYADGSKTPCPGAPDGGADTEEMLVLADGFKVLPTEASLAEQNCLAALRHDWLV